MQGKATPSQGWFDKHKDCKLEIRDTDIPGLKDYRCTKHGRGLITSAKPGDPPAQAGDILKAFGGV